MYKILIDTVTGTVLNFDDKVSVVDTKKLDDFQQAVLDEWYMNGHDSVIIGLAEMCGTPITEYLPDLVDEPTKETNQ